MARSLASKVFQISDALQKAGLPLQGVCIRGEQVFGQYTRSLTPEEEAQAAAILAADYPEDKIEILERRGYNTRRILLCILELLLEDRMESAYELRQILDEEAAEKG